MDYLAIEQELRFKTARSSGKGGQHVNKTETKVALYFDVSTSEVLTDAEKVRIRERLAKYLNKEGQFRLDCGSTRTQKQNKQQVVRRFHRLIAEALLPEKKRIPTKKSKRADKKRLEAKRRKSEKKKTRGWKLSKHAIRVFFV